MNSILYGIGALLLFGGMYIEVIGSHIIKHVNLYHKIPIYPDAKSVIHVLYGKHTYKLLKHDHKRYAYWLNLTGDVTSILGLLIIVGVSLYL